MTCGNLLGFCSDLKHHGGHAPPQGIFQVVLAVVGAAEVAPSVRHSRVHLNGTLLGTDGTADSGGSNENILQHLTSSSRLDLIRLSGFRVFDSRYWLYVGSTVPSTPKRLFVSIELNRYELAAVSGNKI